MKTSLRHRGGVVAVLLLLAACTREPTVVLHPREGSPVEVGIEIADTGEQRNRGLMYRTELGENRGMLFLFEKDAHHGFWMKNTPLPLDMIFISAEGTIVGIAPDTEPFSLRPVTVGAPSRAVLEVNAGFAKRHGIRPGDRVEYRHVTSPLLPP